VLVEIFLRADERERPHECVPIHLELDIHHMQAASGASEVISSHLTVYTPTVSILAVFQDHCSRHVRAFLEKDESHRVLKKFAVDVEVHLADPLPFHIHRLEGSSSPSSVPASEQSDSNDHKQHDQTPHSTPFHPSQTSCPVLSVAYHSQIVLRAEE